MVHQAAIFIRNPSCSLQKPKRLKRNLAISLANTNLARVHLKEQDAMLIFFKKNYVVEQEKFWGIVKKLPIIDLYPF